ncbi:MAG: hypothetical protein PUE12_12895 [Oscillospiraceae bacterium]|nr:hypothetical protein [Oscillospiraceae bacterium]
MPQNRDDMHLNVYLDRQELHLVNVVKTYYEGLQSAETKRRYTKITNTLADGYLEDKMSHLGDVDFSELSERNKDLLKALVDGITSEVGRGLVGVAFLQLVVKSITPEQSVRLHKGSTRNGSFSWKDGISMRTLDSNYTAKFLKTNGLLNLNKYGSFMTRSLAENYPYSQLYKAEMRGPFNEWIAIVDAIEDESMPAEMGLSYLMALLKNRSDNFTELANQAINLADGFRGKSFDEIESFMIDFYNTTDYSARAFEVVIHGFMQAMVECHFTGDLGLVPMSQMRSANKKHGNIGDVEMVDGRVIVEAWDAKYGKPYLRDELEELRDKIFSSPGVQLAGFIVDREVDRRKEIVDRANEIEFETSVEIKLLSFKEWVAHQTKSLTKSDKNELAGHWLIAVVESFAQRRLEIAPIDEPCEAWVQDLIQKMK